MSDIRRREFITLIGPLSQPLVVHPQEPTGEEWWADMLADLRARTGRDVQKD